jgi:zinc protease
MRRLITLVFVLSLVGGACTRIARDGVSVTTAFTTTTSAPTTTTRGPAAMPVFADDDEPLEIDPAVRQGVLANGLTFYIRENAAPGGHAQLRLAVKAGSVQETADQRGVAHYLEHMMFNGTERYPANELVRVLQRFGAEFGPDINAYTSYEETVYFIDLATDDPATIETGLDVLVEWASAATIDPVEVSLEKGVLLEEWRVRDQGFWGRYFVGVTDRLLAGTLYAERNPLAGPALLDTTTVEGLRDFYDTWYRPDNMALVAVGDFDADDMEALIEERFGGLAPRGSAEPVPELTTEPFSEPAFLIMADPESPETFVELNYPVPVDGDPSTVGSVRQSIAGQIAFDIIATRLREDTLEGVTPFFDPSFAANPLVRAQASPGVAAYTTPEDLGATTEALLLEVERARRLGFTPDELDRAVERYRALVEAEYEQRGSTQDRQYASTYVEHFLGGEPATSATKWRALSLRLLEEMTIDQVWATFATAIESTQPLVILAGPEASAEVFPDEDALGTIIAEIAASTIPPRDDEVIEVAALMERPEPAGVTSRRTFSDTGLPLLVLDNGARVVLFPTTIHEGHTTLIAASPGGWALLTEGEVAEAKLLDAIIGGSGLADLDAVALDRHLVGKVVSLAPFVDEVEEGFFGEASTKDLEILLQLLYLQMTQPRFDPIAVDIVQKRWQPVVDAPNAVPDRAVAVALAELRYPDDPRFGYLLTPTELEALDLAEAQAVFADRFGNAADFVFALVGDFEASEAEDLVRRYIGSLPSASGTEGYENVRPEAPIGVVEHVVQAGMGVRGGVAFHFTTPVELDPENRVATAVLEAVIQDRLTTHIREELSASYSPVVRIDIVEEPEGLIEVMIRIDGDPANLDQVVAATLETLRDLVEVGPTDDEFAIAREQVFRNYQLIDNFSLADAIIFSAFHPGEAYSEIVTRIDRVLVVEVDDIRDLAERVVTLDDYIEVRLVPVGFSG